MNRPAHATEKGSTTMSDTRTAQQLPGKTAIVTGGTSGIGLAIVRRFVEEGAHVVVTGRRQAHLDALAAELGSQVTPVRCDMSDLDDIDRLTETIIGHATTIDVYVANAGGGVPEPLGEITEREFDATFATNVKGVVFGVQKIMPVLSPGASVIIIGSTTSRRPDPGLEVYGATKAAVRNFARSWARDAQALGFRVNVLSPGPTDTPALRGLAPVAEQEALVRQFGDGVPIGRIGNPEEVAAAATFLASDASGYVNGAEWFIDGGYAQV